MGDDGKEGERETEEKDCKSGGEGKDRMWINDDSKGGCDDKEDKEGGGRENLEQVWRVT